MIVTERPRGAATDGWVSTCWDCGAQAVTLPGRPRAVVIHAKGCLHVTPPRVTDLRWVGPSYLVRGRTRIVACLWHRGRWEWKAPHRSSSHQYGYRWPGLSVEVGRARLTVSRARCSA